MSSEKIICYDCGKEVAESEYLYSYIHYDFIDDPEPYVSEPACIEDIESAMEEGDEIGGPYCPHCLAALE